MTTQTKPTPEQLTDDCLMIAAYLREEAGSFFATCRAERLEQLAALLAEGAVIVHPDDVPAMKRTRGLVIDEFDNGEVCGWNACRAHIFGETAE